MVPTHTPTLRVQAALAYTATMSRTDTDQCHGYSMPRYQVYDMTQGAHSR